MKHTTAFVFGLILPVAVMTTVIDGARAEGFVDIRGGAAITQNTDATGAVGPLAIPSLPIKFEAARGTVGIRGGYWLDSVPWLGFAFDLSYFEADEDASDPVEFNVFPISGLLILRYPLMKSDDYPRGRLQPYAGVGPSAVVSTAKLDLSAVSPDNFSDTQVNLGLDVRGGVNFHFALPDKPLETWAIFLEYRFTHFEPSKYKEDILGVPTELEVDQLDTHHIVVGLGIYF